MRSVGLTAPEFHLVLYHRAKYEFSVYKKLELPLTKLPCE